MSTKGDENEKIYIFTGLYILDEFGTKKQIFLSLDLTENIRKFPFCLYFNIEIDLFFGGLIPFTN